MTSTGSTYQTIQRRATILAAASLIFVLACLALARAASQQSNAGFSDGYRIGYQAAQVHLVKREGVR